MVVPEAEACSDSCGALEVLRPESRQTFGCRLLGQDLGFRLLGERAFIINPSRPRTRCKTPFGLY